MRSRIALTAGLPLLASVLLLQSAPSASAAGAGPGRPYQVKDLRVVSGPSPFAAGCPGPRDDQVITGHELEPAITVNPSDPRNIVATWKQDVGPDQSRSDLVGSSLDGGKTWTRSTIPGLTRCTGGAADMGSDPWVSAGRDGTVYFTGLAARLSTQPPQTAVVASRSRDGGRTWRAAVTVAPPLGGNEQPAVTGSPARAGRAYLAFANFLSPDTLPRTNTLEFSRTADGGATWSSPVLIDQPGQFAIDFAPKVVVLKDGTLLAVFGRADIEHMLGQIYAARSADEGRTWQLPVLVGSRPIHPEITDETGAHLPDSAFPSAAVAPDGSVYVAFEDNTSASSGTIGVARSRDGGRTWTSARLPGVSAFAFQPSIAVDSHGIIGVTWYDLRHDRPGDAALTADVWFAYSADRGASWRQAHVAGPTDLRTAPLPAHNYVGEYQGLAALPGRGFAAIFTLAAPQARNGPTDIFFARIGPG
jgi:hypothetical protein